MQSELVNIVNSTAADFTDDERQSIITLNWRSSDYQQHVLAIYHMNEFYKDLRYNCNILAASRHTTKIHIRKLEAEPIIRVRYILRIYIKKVTAIIEDLIESDTFDYEEKRRNRYIDYFHGYIKQLRELETVPEHFYSNLLCGRKSSDGFIDCINSFTHTEYNLFSICQYPELDADLQPQEL